MESTNKYTLVIVELLRKEIVIEAKDAEKALEIGKTNYRKACDGYVLTADDLNDVGIFIKKSGENAAPVL